MREIKLKSIIASSSTTNYELRKQIFLVGYVRPWIVAIKLPTKIQALQVLFFWTRRCNLTIRESVNRVIREVSLFWEKAGIPIQKQNKCIDKLVSLHTEHKNVERHKD